jgi:hypothetical protein
MPLYTRNTDELRFLDGLVEVIPVRPMEKAAPRRAVVSAYLRLRSPTIGGNTRVTICSPTW